jgi:hypothetical protein
VELTLYIPLPVAWLRWMGPRKTEIVSPGQQGLAPMPTRVPAKVITGEAGVGYSLRGMMDLSGAVAAPVVLTAQ